MTEATGLAASNEPEPKDRRASLWERTADLREDVARRIKNPAPLDKAFFDSLYDQRRNRDTHGE